MLSSSEHQNLSTVSETPFCMKRRQKQYIARKADYTPLTRADLLIRIKRYERIFFDSTGKMILNNNN